MWGQSFGDRLSSLGVLGTCLRRVIRRRTTIRMLVAAGPANTYYSVILRTNPMYGQPAQSYTLHCLHSWEHFGATTAGSRSEPNAATLNMGSNPRFVRQTEGKQVAWRINYAIRSLVSRGKRPLPFRNIAPVDPSKALMLILPP